ncbi:MAG: hypothetical protein Q9217_002193 [Psora testacea]
MEALWESSSALELSSWTHGEMYLCRTHGSRRRKFLNWSCSAWHAEQMFKLGWSYNRIKSHEERAPKLSMPQDPPRSEHIESSEESPSLSDQNVAILYEIVQYAEQHANVEAQPFRAIFAAYDRVLPQYGLDPAHDQVYLRFLFRLGDKRGRHESLFESFERLLEDLGIQIEFNTEDDAVQDVTRDVSQNGNRYSGQPSQRRSRRVSFNSMYDAEDESTHVIRTRANSRASMSRLQIGEKSKFEARPSTRATIRPTEKAPADPLPLEKRRAQTPRRRLIAEKSVDNLQGLQREHAEASSKNEYGRKPAIKLGRSSGLNNVAIPKDNLSISSSATEDKTIDEASCVHQGIRPFQLDLGERFYTPSRTQLLRDAETFQHYRIRSVARDIVERWCDAALQAEDHHEHLERMAVAHDREILLRQAFEHWRARLHARKLAAETKRFFDHLERRAVKARDLYLLTKAFTHWAQCAQDEAQRSLGARQHALGIKYFFAWRDITLENNNKVRYQGFKRSFGIWKQRYVRNLTDGVKADLLHQQTLLKDSYWHWFWTFCERRAPEWHAQRLKQRVFLQWVRGYRNNARQLQLLDQNANRRTKRDVLSQWLEITRVCLSNRRQAVTFDRRKTAGYALRAWARKQRFTPFAQQVSNMVDWRVAGATFATFVNRFRFEKQAANINQLRILRNVWTQWNDRLRWQTMTHRLDDRYLLETLYKWVIAERCLLMRRLSGERLKGRYLREWLLRLSTHQNQREQALLVMEKRRGNACLWASLTKWRSELGQQHQAQHIAFEFHAPKLAQEAVELWKQCLKHSQQMDLWAKDAELFFFGKRYLKRWREAMSESRRQKRREAYVRVRRRSKMSLTSGLLQRWRAVTAHMIQLQQQADNAGQQRLLRVGTKIFNQWKNAYELTMDQHFDAREHFEKQMLKRYLRMWTAKASIFESLEETAEVNAELRAQKTAFVFLRRLRLRMIELKGQQGKAEGLRRNYEKRHILNLLRQWSEKVTKRQIRSQEDRNFSAKIRRTTRLVEDNGFGATRRVDDWTELDVGDWIPGTEAQSNTTPLPGYLSTPSKRAARAKALVQTTTPAGTPFQNRLRAQLNATPRTTKRGPFGRSTSMRGSMFAALLEESPRTAETLASQNEQALIASMRTVLPGKPQAKLQAVSTVQWQGKRLIAYVSGNALVILGGSHDLIQTTYHDQCEALGAVVIDEVSGKIATCSSDEIYVYKPYGREEGILKWSLQSTFLHLDNYHEIPTLSWGSEEELLVGSSSLRLHQTAREEGRVIWDRKLPNPVKIASFSSDATLIASSGWHDRLIKLWRRQSFGSDDTRFDFSYLPHPTAVTAIYWRRPPYHEPYHREQHMADVLFSICVDGKVRIWAANGPHALQALQLWAEIDMQQCLQPRRVGEGPSSNERYAFFIDSRDFVAAADCAVKANADNKGDEAHAIEHLKEVVKTKPDICVVLDRRGNMSAWGLENVGCKVRKPADVFNVAHIKDLNLPFMRDVDEGEDNVQFLYFCNEQSPSPFTLLTHHFDGRITWHESSLIKLFDPSPRSSRLQAKALWTGHDGPVKQIVRNGSGKALMTRTSDNESLVWRRNMEKSVTLLTRQSSLGSNEPILRSCILMEGDFVLNLHPTKISLWYTQSLNAREVASCTFEAQSNFLTLLLLPSATSLSHVQYVAAVTSKMSGLVWEVVLPSKSHPSLMVNGDAQHSSIREFCTFDVGIEDEMSSVLPIDRACDSPAATDFLDASAKDLAFSYDRSGALYGWSCFIDRDSCVLKCVSTITVYTHIRDPSLGSGSSTRKGALIDASKTRLTIWDMRSGQLEYDITSGPQDNIQDLGWSSTPDQQSILAVGFPHRVTILTQMRYDYLDAGPAWESIREIRIKELTSHPIGDSVWLDSGNFVVAAGNQLYVYDEGMSMSDDIVANLDIPVHGNPLLNIFDLVSYLNSPLPVYHPQFLGQSILANDSAHVRRIILALHKALKFFVPGDELDSYLSMPLEIYISGPEEETSRTSYVDAEDEEEPNSVAEDIAASLTERLTKLALPYITNSQQIRLASIIKSVAAAEKHKRSMDDNAMRYHIFFSQHMLHKRQGIAESVEITWREIVWASHSNSQDILADLVSREFQGRLLWEDARESGMSMWMTDLTALRALFEIIARNEYTKTDEKNPIDCSLYYFALRKKNVLLGLWRMAAWNREQAGTQRLLKNNFSEARWKTAALKNAYALLGKRRFEYAAAWFLLAGNLHDAVNVCAHQLEDIQLAIAVARVYEGDGSAVLRSLIKAKLLPQAAGEGNRWLATWAFWMLGQRDMAIRALIEPLDVLVESSRPPDVQTKSYLAHDPSLIVLYKQLREKSLQAVKGAASISPRTEWQFVIQIARQYNRMGCNLLALNLVRNWKFLSQTKHTAMTEGAPADLLEMNMRGSSQVQDDAPKSPTGTEEKRDERPAPTMFKEPEASSLLDNFGF